MTDIRRSLNPGVAASHNRWMSTQKYPVNRTLVGVIALSCLGTAVGLWLFAAPSGNVDMWKAGFLRVGIVMSAFWLALPSGTRPAAWANVSRGTLIGGALMLLVLTRVPLRIVLPIALAAAIATVFVRPRQKPTPGNTRR